MQFPKYSVEDKRFYYDLNIEKGWVVLPSNHRMQKGKKVILTKGFDNLIYLYFETEFSEFSEALRKLSSDAEKFQKDAREIRAVTRFFAAAAIETKVRETDNAIWIPKFLRDYMTNGREYRQVRMFQSSRVPYTWGALGVISET